MKYVHILLALALGGVIVHVGEANAQLTVQAAIMAAQTEPSTVCSYGVEQVFTGSGVFPAAGTAKASLQISSGFTTIKNQSATALRCGFCDGLTSSTGFTICNTSSCDFQYGLADVPASGAALCCMVAAGTLAFSASFGQRCTG